MSEHGVEGTLYIEDNDMVGAVVRNFLRRVYIKKGFKKMLIPKQTNPLLLAFLSEMEEASWSIYLDKYVYIDACNCHTSGLCSVK